MSPQRGGINLQQSSSNHFAIAAVEHACPVTFRRGARWLKGL